MNKDLEKEGYEVECFGDGESLLEAFEKKAPDLCILDIMMPGMDGLTVCTQIRKTSHVLIIIVSAKEILYQKTDVFLIIRDIDQF